ncbi:DNA packaging tegument protein UL17 [Chimpanzee herpesvirus strain 105640]|uniref:DNA packaging tegument protein UL17 n=1 Tax=Chimpanzee herpesvirus strain 105640 TaxID=332937 RepID=K9MHT0_9ALPH|nr:DNA packaging tegument protein UL17 [Chimpanzee herpesvirus strain 105640]AFV26905.1 DNA packaging tegument protein UL17 [Chimpanzee herpesvirus strain 105640]
MNAHFANEVQYDINRDPSSPASLIHVILSSECLAAAGVPLSALVRGRPDGGATANFRVETQTRAHATGDCTPWRSAFAAYMPADAVGAILAPVIPAHPDLLPRVPSAGGLFVSLPVACDAQGVYDPYTVAALRLAWGPWATCARVLLFSYDELVPPNTRYAADGARLMRLCRHFCRYVARLGAAAPAAAKEAAAHLSLGMGESGTPNPQSSSAPPGAGPTTVGPPEPPISPEEQLTAPGGDTATTEDVSITQENEEILALVQRAVQDVTRRHPVRARPKHAASGVASGLRQGALVHQAVSGGALGASDAEAVLAGLEPPGGGRFATPGAPRAAGEDILNDVLTLVPGAAKPRSLVEWLDRGWEALACGDRPDWLWSRRSISVVLRHHYGTKQRFVVVSYENSVAWGGRRARPPQLSSELATALTEACAAERVVRPHQLSPAGQTALLRRFPALEGPLRHPRPVLPPFDIAAEVAFVARIQIACLRALGHSIRAALQGGPRISQRLRYDFGPDQSEWIGEVTRRFPVLLENLMRAIEGTAPDAFFHTAYALAVLAHLGGQGGRGRRLVPLSDDIPARFADSNAHYVFDYYSTSGDTLRLTNRPIAVVIDGDVNRCEQSKCRFMEGSPSTAPRRVCEQYLPGESYAYLCLGFNRRLCGLVVFPGGFAFTINTAAYLSLADPVARAVVLRFCRRLAAGSGLVR